MTALRHITAPLVLTMALGGILSPRAIRAQAVTTSIPVSIFGEVRSRSEGDWPGGGLATDVYTYLRTRLGIRADPATGVRIVAQVQDSRVFGAEGNTTATNPDAIELHQGYLELGTAWGPRDFLVRVGRQEVIFGNERLVGAADWTNTARSFDGARVLLTPRGSTPGAEQWTATAFAATVEERGRKFGAVTTPAPSSPAPDHMVAGLFGTRLMGTGSLEATALFDAGGHYRTFADANKATFDARLRQGRNREIGFDLETAWQTGTQQYQANSTALVVNQDVSAWLVGARVTRPAADGRRVTGAIGVDILSGDNKATDGGYSAFNTMYATNHPFYGLMDLFLDPAARTNDRGLIDALATTAITLPPRTTLKVELHHFAPQAGVPGEIGWEADVIAPVRLSSAATMELGYTAFRAGPAAAAMGLGANGTLRHWAYLQLKAGF
jgi:hypothetical protein